MTIESTPKRTLYAYENQAENELARHIATTLYRYDRIAERRLPTLQDLTDEQVKLFWQQGYLVIENVLSEVEVERSISAIMDILAGKTIGPKIQFVGKKSDLLSIEERELAARKISEYIDHEPNLHSIAFHDDILKAMGKLFNEQAVVVQDQAILKPPTGGAEKPWHQDMAYGNLAYDKSVIGAWIALDAAELDNGCMHVIPYSHMDGAVPHYAERDWQLCDRNVAVVKDVAVPLKPGGVLLFSGLLHHGTPPNFSDKRRRALQFHYAPESAKKLTPQEYKRMFTNELTGAEC
ncbi:phytanoyl-CoA dioxygenase family protein [Paenibacillus psychroresistens]|uniref:Phytanoyl-CoA dioxygenase family protein n=1 Tax=Paenibacillus psychroresistens TaxID=1778678 RepID=A0A6B8RQF6_9BACL|nr:phytanoyl-CoA dioxygenase family protein [Paenibacillus psychroresistens]QGQ98034.1 phytanoyl-CoA dioxygenase family protein [Paenibacillus psychroresistens]